MALTQISTAGVKDDAVTAGKIPADAVGSSEIAANAVGSSELADNAVDTAAIADDAVTFGKIQHVAHSTVVGRAAGSTTGTTKAMTAAEVRTILNVADGATNSTTTTINTNADNRVITGSGSADTLNGEANLTYDGDKLIVKSGTHDGGLEVLAANNNQTSRIKIQGKHSGGSERNWFVEVPRGSDILNFFDDSHGSHTQLIDNGNLSIVDGNLAVADGHGIDFSATSDTGGMTSELLDDYEEGTFTPNFNMSGGGASLTYTTQQGSYTKIGNVVTIEIYINVGTVNANGTGSLRIGGLPFNKSSRYGALTIAYLQGLNNVEISNLLVDINSNQIFLYAISQATNNWHTTNLTIAGAFTNNTEIILGGSYLAA